MSIPFLLSEKPAAVALRLGPENSREAPERFDMEPLARTRVEGTLGVRPESVL